MFVVTSTNDNATYHLSEIGGMRMVVPVAGKRVKAFKKWQDARPDPEMEDEDVDEYEESEVDWIGDRAEEDK